MSPCIVWETVGHELLQLPLVYAAQYLCGRGCMPHGIYVVEAVCCVCRITLSVHCSQIQQTYS